MIAWDSITCWHKRHLINEYMSMTICWWLLNLAASLKTSTDCGQCVNKNKNTFVKHLNKIRIQWYSVQLLQVTEVQKHTHVVDIGGDPTSIRQFLQIVGCLVVATNEDRQNGSLLFTRVISAREVDIILVNLMIHLEHSMRCLWMQGAFVNTVD